MKNTIFVEFTLDKGIIKTGQVVRAKIIAEQKKKRIASSCWELLKTILTRSKKIHEIHDPMAR